MKPPSRPDKPNVCTTAPSALSPRARGPPPTRTPSFGDAKALARHTDASLGAAESRPPDRRARSACVALSMPLGTRAVQDRPGRAFRRSTNSEDNAGAFGRSGVRDSLCVEDRAPATPLSRSPANTHRKPKAATAHATACRGVNLAVSLLGTSPVSSLKRVARRGAPSVDAPGRDEVVIASLAFLVPSGVPNAPNAISPRRRAGRPLVASRARAAHRTGRVRCLAVSRFRSQRGAPSGVPRPVARAGTPRRVAVSGAFQTPD